MSETDADKTIFEELHFQAKTFFAERLSSPFISTFVISWLLTNYQFVLITLSEASILNKLTLTHDYFHKFYYLFYSQYLPIPNWVLSGLFLPILATYIYVYHFPRIGNKFYMQAVHDKLDLARQRNAKEGLEMVKPEIVEGIHELYKKKIEKYLKKIQELQSEIESQNSVIDSLENKDDLKNKDESKTNDDLENKDNLKHKDSSEKATIDKGPFDSFTDNEADVIIFIGQSLDSGQVGASVNSIRDALGISLSKINFAITTLISRGYLAQNYDEYGEVVYELTKNKGLKAYIEIDL